MSSTDWRWCVCVLWYPCLLWGVNPTVTVGVGANASIERTGLIRVAVGNTKIIRAKAVGEDRILVTGVKPGKAALRVWSAKGEEEILIHVLDAEAYQAMRDPDRERVVRVALEFLELDRTFFQDLGLKLPDTIQFGASAGVAGSQNVSGLNYALSFGTTQGWLRQLRQEGWAKLLANPDLYVRLGEEVQFHSGGEFPVSTSNEYYGKVYRHVSWKPFGVTVKVRPQSGDLVHFSSEIDIEISEMNRSLQMEGIPSISRRKIQTKMQSLEGDTVILSGLTREVTSKHKEGTPGLSSLPILGHLFGTQAEFNESTELLMAVTFSVDSRVDRVEKLNESQRRIVGSPP